MLYAAFVYLIFLNTTVAQTNSDTRFKVFFEKAYLHTDREFYIAGDDVWYKAYLVNAISNHPTATSNNLYVELIAFDATLINRQVIHLENGMGNGDFRLPDTLSAGTYHVRAYTNWMKNFGDNFIFERSIKIGNKKSNVTTNKNITTTKSTKQNNASNTAEYRLQFFPEGGSLLANAPCVVAFKAEDAVGRSIAVTGNIINSKGKAVAAFKTSNKGMGSFIFTPESNETYEVKAQFNNTPISSDLPFALDKGFQLSIKEINTDYLLATITTNNATLKSFPNTLITLAGKHGGKLFFEDSVRLSSTQASIKIPKNQLPQGIAVITLYDEKMRPNNERLVFINKAPAATLSIQSAKTVYATNENPSITINTVDSFNTPLKANLSLAVVDATVVPSSNTNIINYLFLQSELKGTIENVDSYFDKNNTNRLQQLDLLLLTQGWREFVWTKLAQEGIKIKYLPEAGITISGRVKRTFSEKPLPNMNVTLFATQAKGNKLFATKTDSAGRYYFDGIQLYGIQKIKLVSKDNKGDKGGMITMDTLFKNLILSYPFNNPTDTAIAYKAFEEKATERLAALNKVKDDEIKELPGVTVTTKSNKDEVTRDDVITKFGYKDITLTPTAGDLKDYGSLENYLHHLLPGAHDDVEHGGIYFIGDMGAQIRPRFHIDNREDIFDRVDYYELPVDQISQIVVKHGISVLNQQHAYHIYLTLKPGALDKTELESINPEVTGYYEARNFYVPQPKMNGDNINFLTTVLWMPNLQTTKNNDTKLVINNKNMKSKFRIVVEGITESGVPVAGVFNYEVK